MPGRCPIVGCEHLFGVNRVILARMLLVMGRIAKRLFKIADQLMDLDEEHQRVAAELEYHRLIDDDAQRDAAVSGATSDRLEASATSKDVSRFEKRLREIAARREKLHIKRARLLDKL